MNSARASGARVAVALTALAVVGAGGSATRAETLDLVGQLDPYLGGHRYGDVWGDTTYAYIGAFVGSGVGIIDISDPGAPFLAATYGAGAGGRFKDVKVNGGIGYFASDSGGGLHIVDLADPTLPALLSQVTSLDGGYDSIHNVFVANGTAYEADSRTETLKVFDVSDPSDPFFVRDIVTPDASFIHDVTVVGDRLYASGWAGFTYIYDIANIGTTAPTLLGQVPSGSNSHSSWATSDGNLLITVREISNGDVRIFDISDPGAPVLLSTLSRTSLGIDAYSPHNPVLYSDTLLFVSWYQAGVVAIDLSDPADPVLLGNYDTFPGAVSGFDGNWGVYPLLGLDRLLLSDLDGGLFIVDATAIAVPVPGLVGGMPWLLAAVLIATGSAWLRRTAPAPAVATSLTASGARGRRAAPDECARPVGSRGPAAPPSPPEAAQPLAGPDDSEPVRS